MFKNFTAIIFVFFAVTGIFIEASAQAAANLIQQNKLTASDGAANDHFGKSVAIAGNKIIVGAYTDTIAGNQEQGSAYVFRREGANWVQEAKLTAPDGAAGDWFGWAVAFDGVNAVITAQNDDVNGNVDQGSAYLFENVGNQWIYGTWFILNTDGTYRFLSFGQNQDLPIPAAYIP